jgi:hypothetical protein
MATAYKSGDEVPASGIYDVVHNPAHAQPHQVTCVKGKTFPSCKGCLNPRFTLWRAAHYIQNHEHFRGGGRPSHRKPRALQNVVTGSGVSGHAHPPIP